MVGLGQFVLAENNLPTFVRRPKRANARAFFKRNVKTVANSTWNTCSRQQREKANGQSSIYTAFENSVCGFGKLFEDQMQQERPL